MKNKLWIVGCSISHGVGVDPGQCWGALAATQLDLAPEFLTAEGYSIEWAADQILKAPIGPADTVLWGLTTPNRSMWYDDAGQVHHILNVYYQNHSDFDQTLHRREWFCLTDDGPPLYIEQDLEKILDLLPEHINQQY
jgi:hypothetical protein